MVRNAFLIRMNLQDYVVSVQTFLAPFLLLIYVVIECARNRNLSSRISEGRSSAEPMKTTPVNHEKFAQDVNTQPIEPCFQPENMCGTLYSMLEKRLETGYYDREIDKILKKKLGEDCIKREQKTQRTITVTKRSVRDIGGPQPKKDDEAVMKEFQTNLETCKNMEEQFQKMKDILDSQISEISKIQDDTERWMREEFGKDGALNIGWVEKLASITSRMAKRVAESAMGSFPAKMEKFEGKIRKMDASKNEQYLGVLGRLAFLFHFHGDVCMATNCLATYIAIHPTRILVDMTLAWMVYLGDNGAVAEYVAKCDDQPILQFYKLFVAYWSDTKKRPEILAKIGELKFDSENGNINSILQKSYTSWMRSFLSNVETNGELKAQEFPERLTQLYTSSHWSAHVVQSQMPGLCPKSSRTDEANFWRYFESVKMDTCLLVVLGSTISWMLESRRNWALAKLASAQSDAREILAQNWRVSLRMASPYRVLQAMNALTNYYMVIGGEQSCQYSNILQLSLLNFMTPNPTLITSDVPTYCATLESGERRCDRSVEFFRQKIACEMEARIISRMQKKDFRKSTDCCACFSCKTFRRNCFFAAEYIHSFMIFCHYSTTAMLKLDVEYDAIVEQYRRARNFEKTTFPNFDEIYGNCAIRWLTNRLGGNVTRDDERLMKSVQMRLSSTTMHTFTQRLIFAQLVRQHQTPLRNRYSWMGVTTPSRHAEMAKENPHYAGLMKDVTGCLHVLDREWRPRAFAYLARSSNSSSFKSACAWAESTSIGWRSMEQRKSEICQRGKFTFRNPKEFQKRVASMPKHLTVVQIALADNGDVYLIKLHADHSPIIVPLLHATRVAQLVDEWDALLNGVEEKVDEYAMREYTIVKDLGGDRGEVLKEVRNMKFWEDESLWTLHVKMERFVERFQSVELGVFAHLLLPSAPFSTRGEEFQLAAAAIKHHSMKMVSRREAMTFVHLAARIDADTWRVLFNRYLEFRGVGEQQRRAILSLYDTCQRVVMGGEMVAGYTCLVICPELAHFCWEHLPIFKSTARVTRVLSVHHVFRLLDTACPGGFNEIRTLPRGSQPFFVVDPDCEMGDLYAELRGGVLKRKLERGVCRRWPDEKELVEALGDSAAFFYLGTGNGQQQIVSALKKVKCRTPCFLLHQESLKIRCEGFGFDGSSVLAEYAMWECPLICGWTWRFLDLDMIRVTTKLMRRVLNGFENGRCVPESAHSAKLEAIFKTLTGYSLVVYGLPTRWT